MKKTKTKILTVLVLILLADVPSGGDSGGGCLLYRTAETIPQRGYQGFRDRKRADWAISSGSSGISGRDVVVLPDYQCQEVPEAS